MQHWLLTEIEKLIVEHGGTLPGNKASANGANGHAARVDTAGDLTAFGVRVDGREDDMTRHVWGRVVGLYRQSPIKPADTSREMQEAYEAWEGTVKPRASQNGATKGELLELEGRGITLYRQKWARAMGKWETEIREAAKVPPEGVVQVSVQTQAPDDPGPFSAATLAGTAPARQWIVPEWIAEGVVNSLYGMGGIGKTLLAQQLAYCLAAGIKFLGMDLPRKKTLCVLCEDDRDEIHRRHVDLKAGLGHAVGNPFGDCWLWPRVGHENLLVTWDQQTGQPRITLQFQLIMDEVRKGRFEFLVLDTLADIYGGNEIARVQANHFIKAVLGRLILEARDAGFTLTVLVLAHPSNVGVSTGTGASGSTAWENAVRARLYLRAPDNGDINDRELVRMKANYAVSGEDTVIRMRWQAGCFVLSEVDESDIRLKSAKSQIISAVRGAWEARKPYTPKKGHRRNIYRAVQAEMGARFDHGILSQAIRELIEDGVIVVDRRKDGRGLKVADDDEDSYK